MEPFRYDTLDVPSREIRLLDLLPGSWGEDIHCQLSTASLDDLPEYETISYVWGDSSVRRPIIVDETIFMVTVNLEKALRRLRRQQTSRRMWADAICINQEGLDERSHQVSIMGAVYKECREVQIWLGEENDLPLEPLSPEDLWTWQFISKGIRSEFEKFIESHNIKHVAPLNAVRSVYEQDSQLDVPAALQLLRLLAEDKHFYDLPFFEITEFPSFTLCNNWLCARNSLVNIFSRPWWTRMWTAQEAILPPKATVHLGAHNADLQLFFQAGECFWDHYYRNDCCLILEKSPGFQLEERLSVWLRRCTRWGLYGRFGSVLRIRVLKTPTR